MQKWFKDKKNPFDGKMKKTELYEIIKLKKPEPVHKTDEFLRGKYHDVLGLPPYHCEYNPIEMVWGMSRVMLDGKITLLKLMM
jgi:hypothetical protein